MADRQFALHETGERAVSGATVLVARSAFVVALGLGANVVLARLLAPRDFGLVALGSVIVFFATFLSEAGLGAGLVRRSEPPTPRELQAVTGLQLALTGALAMGALAAGSRFGRDGLVVALMVASLPLTTLKVPSVIQLERALEYKVIAKVDLIEAGVFYGWALVTVALGAGVWGFASAVIARSLAGALAMLRFGPTGFVRPRWSWRDLRPVLGFGAKFQATAGIALVRDQTLNVCVAAIGGIATLGMWNLSWRVLQIQAMVFGQFGRIGFPAMARVMAAGEDPRPILERGGAAMAVLSAAMGVVLVGFAPALPRVLGPGWDDVPQVLLFAGVASIAMLPVVLACVSYLFATDNAGSVVIAGITGATIWFAVAFPLLPSLGAPAVGIGWCVGMVGQLPLLLTRTSAHSGAAVATSIGAPVALGIVAAVAGWLLADAAGGSVVDGLGGVLAGETLLLGALVIVRRSAMRDMRGLLGQALAGLARGSAAADRP